MLDGFFVSGKLTESPLFVKRAVAYARRSRILKQLHSVTPSYRYSYQNACPMEIRWLFCKECVNAGKEKRPQRPWLWRP
jgi:hypothetical protein